MLPERQCHCGKPFRRQRMCSSISSDLESTSESVSLTLLPSSPKLVNENVYCCDVSSYKKSDGHLPHGDASPSVPYRWQRLPSQNLLWRFFDYPTFQPENGVRYFPPPVPNLPPWSAVVQFLTVPIELAQCACRMGMTISDSLGKAALVTPMSWFAHAVIFRSRSDGLPILTDWSATCQIFTIDDYKYVTC